MEENPKSKESLDIVWVIKYIYSKRRFIIKFVGASIIFFTIICLLRPKIYKAEASILPISNNTNPMSKGNLGSLASLAGVDLNSFSSSSSNNIITSELYPRIASSTPFLMEMCNVKLEWKDRDKEMSLFEYVESDTIKSIGDYIIDFTIGLPGTISKWLNGDADKTPRISSDNEDINQYLSLTKYQKNAIKKMAKMITVEEDPTIESLMAITVVAESPKQATILASKVLETMQKTITSFKTKQAQMTLDFVEKRYNEILTEYKTLRESLFFYEDSHRDMISERVSVEYQQLSDEYQISYSILKALATEKEQSKINLMENTPAFSVVDPVVMPMRTEKFSPRMSLHMIAGFMLGFIFSIGWLILRLGYWQLFAPEKISRLKEQNF